MAWAAAVDVTNHRRGEEERKKQIVLSRAAGVGQGAVRGPLCGSLLHTLLSQGARRCVLGALSAAIDSLRPRQAE